MNKFTKTMLTTLFLCTLPNFAEVKADGNIQDKPMVVYVGGQVARPGVIEYKEKTTIFAVIFAAGGETQFGTLKRVKVFRDGKQVQFDLTNEKVKNTQFANPGDTIEVPQKNILGK